jgi:hypothetical protein
MRGTTFVVPASQNPHNSFVGGVHSIISSASIARDERVNGGPHPRIMSPGHSLSELVDERCA